MGQVIELIRSPANPAVVRAAKEILRRAEAGMQSLMFIGVDAAGEAEIDIRVEGHLA